jgi:hypothetical protein
MFLHILTVTCDVTPCGNPEVYHLTKSLCHTKQRKYVQLPCHLPKYFMFSADIFSLLQVYYNVGVKGKGKVHPCTDTEALYRPYFP